MTTNNYGLSEGTLIKKFLGKIIRNSAAKDTNFMTFVNILESSPGNLQNQRELHCL